MEAVVTGANGFIPVDLVGAPWVKAMGNPVTGRVRKAIGCDRLRGRDTSSQRITPYRSD